MDIAPEGDVYAQRYKVFDYPHIGIIDPRTRRLMWKKEGWTQQNPLTAEQFAEIAMDFCSRHSFDKPPQAPRPSSAAAARPTKRPMHEMSEEEQLQAAMRASLQESGEMTVDDEDYAIDDDDDDEVEVVAVKGADGNLKPVASEAKQPEVDSKPAAAPSVIEQLLSVDIGPDPEKGARIQFRFPDGKRMVRKFDPTLNVRLIYAFVAVGAGAAAFDYYF
jgi:UBX domain-containing protein 7